MKSKLFAILAVVLATATVNAQLGRLGRLVDKATDTGDAKVEAADGEAADGEAAARILPFSVKLAGEAAVVKEKNAVFATVEKAVAADAELELEVDASGMVIINVFAANEKGETKDGAPAIIMFQDTNKGKIDQTMDKKPLEAGTYLMNIVAAGKTARVLFTIK